MICKQPSSRTAYFALCLLVLTVLPDTVISAAQSFIRLVPIDPWTFDVEVNSTTDSIGGELGLGFSGSALKLLSVLAGPDFPVGTGFPGGPDNITKSEVSPSSCPGNLGVDKGLVISWIHPRDSLTGKFIVLPHGVQRVLRLQFAKAPSAVDGQCHQLKFLECLGPAGAPVRNVLTDSSGHSVLLETQEVSVCTNQCRQLHFSPSQNARCKSFVLVLRESDGTPGGALIVRREIPAQGLAGYDLANAVQKAFHESPAGDVVVGLLPSGVQFCRTSGKPLRIFVNEIDSRGVDRELLGGETLGPCGIDLTSGVPSCPDADMDGTCDSSDPCPNSYNAGEPCSSNGFCRHVKFDPLCAFKCASLTFELREADGVTMILGATRTITLPGPAKGLDVAVELCRAFGASPPAGFSVQSVPGGCQICRSNGSPFRIFLRYPGATGEQQIEITTGAVIAACGLRVWAQPPHCEDSGDADVDKDGVCDSVDICPSVFNPSQADLDHDCIGDACQSGTKPFVPADLCERNPLVVLSADSEKRWDFQLTGCQRAACYSLKAPVKKPILLTLEGSNVQGPCSIYVQADSPPEPTRFDLSAHGRGGEPLRLTIPSAASGTIYVRVDLDGISGDPENLFLTARSVDLSLSSISPTIGAQGGRASVIVRGGGFQTTPSPTSFKLVPVAGGDSIPLTSAVIVNSGRAEAVIDLSSVPAVPLGGAIAYHLEAAEVGITARLENAFKVLDPQAASGLEVQVIGQSLYRRNVVCRATIRVRNVGVSELVAPLFKIVAPEHMTLRLARETAFSTSRGNEVLVLGTNPDGFAGRFPPGGVAEIPVVLKSICDSPVCPASLEVFLLTPLPGDTIEWGTLPIPQGMSAEAWTSAQRTLPDRLGRTWADFQRNLADNASRLARRGVDSQSAREQFRFAVREAFVRPSVAVTGRVVDATSNKPLSERTVVALEGAQVVSFGTSDAQGSFALDWLESSRNYRIETVGLTGSVEVTTPGAGDLHNVNLAVSQGANSKAPTCKHCNEENLPETPLFPPAEIFTRIALFNTTIVAARDPNEKTGEDGEGEDYERFIGAGAELVYAIYFENLPGAGAPAHLVEVCDQLHGSLDWNSIRLLDVSVGGRLIPLNYRGAERANGYAMTELPGSASALVIEPQFFGEESCGDVFFTVEANVNKAAGKISWVFRTFDCASGSEVTDDPLRGMLPPNRNAPEGEGFVSFSVALEPDLPDAAPVFNEAEIRFDGEAVIQTNSFNNTFSHFLDAEEPMNPNPKAYEPEKDNRAPVETSLCWSPSRYAREYELSFWRPGDASPTVTRGLKTPCARPPVPLEFDTSYRWQVVARNIRGVETRGKQWTFRTVEKPPDILQAKFHRGDADDNGQLQLTDAVRILGYLFLGGAAPPCLDAADADDNGVLQLTDAVRILGFLFLGGAPPSPPGPPDQPCGIDVNSEDPELGWVQMFLSHYI